MKLYIEQRSLTLIDKFDIYNENGEHVYYAEGEFSFLRKVHVYDQNNIEAIFLHSEFSFKPTYNFSIYGKEDIKMTQRFKLGLHEYDIEDLNWHIVGDFWGHDFYIEENDRIIATIAKKKWTFSDQYVIEIDSKEKEVECLAVLLIIDAMMEDAATAATSSAAN